MNRIFSRSLASAALVASTFLASALAHDGSHGNPELDAMIAQWRAEQATWTLTVVPHEPRPLLGIAGTF